MRGCFEALAASARTRTIAARCCSLVAWSTMLLVFWLLEPVIHTLERFFMPVILSSCFLQASHHSISTTVLSSLLTSQRSHKSVLQSRSNCILHLLKVVTVTFLFLELVEGALSAVLFRFDMASLHYALLLRYHMRSGCGTIVCTLRVTRMVILTGRNVRTGRSLGGHVWVLRRIWPMADCYNAHWEYRNRYSVTVETNLQ